MVYNLTGCPMGFGWWGGGGTMVFMLLVWILIIVLVIWVISKLLNNKGLSKNIFSQHSSEEILKERYAKGEITKKEFEEMKRELRSIK